MKTEKAIKIEKSEMTSLRAKKQHGDIELIASESGISRNTIAAGFKYGIMTPATREAIRNFYSK